MLGTHNTVDFLSLGHNQLIQSEDEEWERVSMNSIQFEFDNGGMWWMLDIRANKQIKW